MAADELRLEPVALEFDRPALAVVEAAVEGVAGDREPAMVLVRIAQQVVDVGLGHAVDGELEVLGITHAGFGHDLLIDFGLQQLAPERPVVERRQ